MYEPNRCIPVIIACIILNNMCIEHNLPLDHDEDSDDEDEDADEGDDNEGGNQQGDMHAVGGVQTRARLVQDHFRRM